jgi:hypothetical protein
MKKMSVAQGIKRYKAAHKFASGIMSQCQAGFPEASDVNTFAALLFIGEIEPADSSAGKTDLDNSRDEVLRTAYEG